MPADDDGPLTLCVLLWPRPGQDDALSHYEDAVLALLADHGSRIVSRVRRTASDGPAAEGPLEVQVIELPSGEALAAYMADPRRAALAVDREAAIERTQILEVTPR